MIFAKGIKYPFHVQYGQNLKNYHWISHIQYDCNAGVIIRFFGCGQQIQDSSWIHCNPCLTYLDHNDYITQFLYKLFSQKVNNVETMTFFLPVKIECCTIFNKPRLFVCDTDISLFYQRYLAVRLLFRTSRR